MAKMSERYKRYRERAESMSWSDLSELWENIKNQVTTDWDPGTALEHLIVRAFQLSGLQVAFPYDVPPSGTPLEQIDGAVYFGDLIFLLECKDRKSIDIEAIAKLRNQLLRRPPTTFGCVFVVGNYTAPALLLADFAVPHRIILWSGNDIAVALQQRDFHRVLVSSQ